MEDIMLLVVAFLMGFVLINVPIPEVFFHEKLKDIREFLKLTISLFGFLIMIYSTVQIFVWLLYGKSKFIFLLLFIGIILAIRLWTKRS
mgnify:CR=1 FL=1